MESLEQPSKNRNAEIEEKIRKNVRKQLELLHERRPWDEKLKRMGEPRATELLYFKQKRAKIQEEIDLINGAMAEWKTENEKLRLQLEPEND